MKRSNYQSQLLSIIIFFMLITASYATPSTDHKLNSTSYGQLNTERLLNHREQADHWLTGGRDYQQSYFSPLRSINKDNIQQLGFAWQYKIQTTHGFEATPIVIDGVMFSSGPRGAVYALNAKAGAELWTFEPSIDSKSMRKFWLQVSRGVSVWQGKVYAASLDGYLYALNANTGDVEWKVDTITDRSRGYSITAAPYIANNVVVIGNSGADYDARGYITAYDIQNGEQRWRFYTVPGHPDNAYEHAELAMAVTTWDHESLWEVGMGGTVWDAMAYDPKLNLLYIGTGNGSPYARHIRSPKGGDNLFLCSIIAINPDTGKMAWHYQTTPGENWDYTSVQKIILAELTLNGQPRKVLMQAPKNGFFYVLDRETGELLSAKPYVSVNWASKVDLATGRPIETGQGDYASEPKLIFPGPAGGHNWQPMAYNPATGLVYIPTMELPAIFFMPEASFQYRKGGRHSYSQYIFPENTLDTRIGSTLPSINKLANKQPDYTIRGTLKAWDPVKQKVTWEVDTSGQWRGDLFSAWNGGGVFSSAGGLVFQGQGTGHLVVYDADTGERLHSIDVGTSMIAAPMTYRIDGEQYVAIMAGLGGALGQDYPPGSAAYEYGNQGRIIAFKLNGGMVPHSPRIKTQKNRAIKAPPPVARQTTRGHVAGKALFQSHCAHCHTNGENASNYPNLKQMDAATHTAFADIVLKGSRADKGMGSFNGVLSASEVTAIHHYLINLAWEPYEQSELPGTGNNIKN